MEAVFEKIGLDLRLVIASSVNFLIFFVILNKFVFNKVAKSLANRQKLIQESIENAEKLKKELTVTKEKAESIIAEANREASEIVQKYKQEGLEEYNLLKIKAEEESRALKSEELAKVAAERERLFKDLKDKTANLAILATKKILENEVNEEKDKKIIQAYLNEIK